MNTKELSKYFSELGKKGGKKRWEGATVEQKSEHGKLMRSKTKRHPLTKPVSDDMVETINK